MPKGPLTILFLDGLNTAVAESGLRAIPNTEIFGIAATHVDQGPDAPAKADRPQAYLQQGIAFKAELPMTPGEYRLRLAVRDTHTGFISTTEIPLKLASK